MTPGRLPLLRRPASTASQPNPSCLSPSARWWAIPQGRVRIISARYQSPSGPISVVFPDRLVERHELRLDARDGALVVHVQFNEPPAHRSGNPLAPHPGCLPAQAGGLEGVHVAVEKTFLLVVVANRQQPGLLPAASSGYLARISPASVRQDSPLSRNETISLSQSSKTSPSDMCFTQAGWPAAPAPAPCASCCALPASQGWAA